MFSEAVLDHFRNLETPANFPRHRHHRGKQSVCGDILKLSARIADGHIAEVRFLCRGCTTSIACASVLTEHLSGRALAEVRSITAETLSEALGGLPPATFHGAQLAVDAVCTLLQNLASKSR